MRVGNVVVTEEVFRIDPSADWTVLKGDTVQDVMSKLTPYIRYHEQEIDRLPMFNVLNALIGYIERGEKITAIKCLREWSGVSLIEAKGMVDRIQSVGVKVARDADRHVMNIP